MSTDPTFSHRKLREPLSRYFLYFYRGTGFSPLGLVLLFLILAFFSGICNILYRAYVSPATKDRVQEIRKLAHEAVKPVNPTVSMPPDSAVNQMNYIIDQIMSDPKKLQAVLPKETENTKNLFYSFLPDQGKSPDELRRKFVREVLLTFARRDTGLIDTAIVYGRLDPCMYIDKIFLRPLIILLLFQFIALTVRVIDALGDPARSVLVEPDKFSDMGKRLFYKVVNSKYTIHSCLLLAVVYGVEHYYSYGVDSSRTLPLVGVYAMKVGFFSVIAVVVLTIILVCLDFDGLVNRKLMRSSAMIVRKTGNSAIAMTVLGIFLHGPTTMEEINGGELMHEMFHYNRFQRFLVDYYTTYGLILLICIFYCLARIVRKFEFNPRFEDEHSLYGFDSLVDLIGLAVLIVFSMFLMIWIQLVESVGANSSRESMYRMALILSLMGLSVLAVSIIVIFRLLLRSKRQSLLGYKEEIALLLSTPPSEDQKLYYDYRVSVLRRSIQNAKSFSFWAILFKVISRRVPLIVLAATLVSIWTLVQGVTDYLLFTP